jgi:hypothetical protein
LIGLARSYVNPPLAFMKDHGKGGNLPLQMDLFQISNPDHIATSIKIENSDLLCMLYSVSSKEEPVSIEAQALVIKRVMSLTTEDIKTLTSFMIGKIILSKR